MKRAARRKIWENPNIIICLVVILVNLLYGLFADDVYVQWKKEDLRDAYEEIVMMDLEDLSEEDEAILQSFQSIGLDFLITDAQFDRVYVGGMWFSDEQIDKYVRGHVDLYQEKPSITVRNLKNMHLLRLRALIVQNQKTYYLYIRREMRTLYEFMAITVVYFGLMGIFVLMMVSSVFRRKPMALWFTGAEKKQRMEDGGNPHLDAAQKEFVANISHELKTPLAVISGQVEMLQTMGNEIDRDYYFSSIREEIDKMSGLVGNLLDITIMEHNIEQMDLTEVDMSDLMAYMLLKYDALFKKNGIKVEMQITGGCCVRGNRMYLEQAVSNYIMNAFQHTAQGKRMRISLAMEEKMAYVGIYNQGEHISEEQMDQIWQSYYMNPSGKREKNPPISNAGLGLYMVKKIVEQHSGACGVENREKGVEFWMRIPLAR